jgi:hypothetical protein
LGAHIVFVDESGFLLIPNVRKTWAPRGDTPIVRHRYRHDRISVISGISIAPQRQRVGLYFQAHAKNIQHDEVCQFLRHLLRHLRGPVIVIWDNASIHKGDRIREICRRFPRLHLERLPPYGGRCANSRARRIDSVHAYTAPSFPLFCGDYCIIYTGINSSWHACVGAGGSCLV